MVTGRSGAGGGAVPPAPSPPPAAPPPPPPPPSAAVPPPAPPAGPAAAPRPSAAPAGSGGVTGFGLQVRGAEIAQRGAMARHPDNVMRLQQADFAPPAFAFRVVFAEDGMKDETAFREVSGIGAEMSVEEVQEGGETRFVHRLPSGVKYKPLVLKRAVASANSNLVKWCRVTLEAGLGRQIRTVPLTVYLLDAEGAPLRAWLFANAYPTRWDVGAFDAMKNELAIETISFSYTYSTRLL